jgi:hypothetical protein
VATLEARLQAALAQVGDDIQELRSRAGALASLTTTDKSSLVAAINEIKAGGGGGGASTLDGLTDVVVSSHASGRLLQADGTNFVDVAGVKTSALGAASVLDGTELVPLVQGGTLKQTPVSAIRVIDIVKTLTATQANSTVTAASVTDLASSLAPGTYLVKVWCCYRSAATTTGLAMYLNCSGGTTTRVVDTWYSLTTGGAAATGILDQATTTTAQMMEGKGQRANNTTSGTTQGVDTANQDQFLVMEGIVIVTATTTLQVMFNSSVAASAVTLQLGTSITISKVA